MRAVPGLSNEMVERLTAARPSTLGAAARIRGRHAGGAGGDPGPRPAQGGLMDEADARAWVEREFDVPRETMARLDAFAALLREENERQNLVSRASLDQLWLRHIADSAQLLRFAPSPSATWVDLGTGAGFPGLIVAVLHRGRSPWSRSAACGPSSSVAPPRRSASQVEIIQARRSASPRRPFDVISARAFAPLDRLLDLGTGFVHNKEHLAASQGPKCADGTGGARSFVAG